METIMATAMDITITISITVLLLVLFEYPLTKPPPNLGWASWRF